MTTDTRKLVEAIVRWFEAHGRDLPWRRTVDPYAIWVSEIMLQQTQVKTVIPYWERWMAQFPTLHALSAASETSVLKAWEGLGYYSRARNLHRAAIEIAAHPGGQFPADYDSILALPGIGRYTAGAIASMAFGQHRPILDGNVARVLSRLFAVRGSPKAGPTLKRLWSLSALLVEAVEHSRGTLRISSLNQGLMELGALICTPRAPQCPACPVLPHCEAARRGQVAKFPAAAPKKLVRPRLSYSYLLISGDRVLVRQRAPGQPNAGLWEFPTVEIPDSAQPSHGPLAGLPLQPFHTLRHTITTHRITLQAWRATVPASARPRLARQLSAQWLPLASLTPLPFSSAQSKLRAQLLNSPPAP